jgi:hypothetical protein
MSLPLGQIYQPGRQRRRIRCDGFEHVIYDSTTDSTYDDGLISTADRGTINTSDSIEVAHPDLAERPTDSKPSFTPL